MRRITSQARLPLARRVTLAVRIVACYAQVRRRLSREPLPALAASFGAVPVRSGEPIPARQLGWAIDRTLRIGSRRPRCIFNALVLYRLLREQGDPAVLVVGLPRAAINKDAHAWVELDGIGRGAAAGPRRARADGEVHMRPPDLFELLRRSAIEHDWSAAPDGIEAMLAGADPRGGEGRRRPRRRQPACT